MYVFFPANEFGVPAPDCNAALDEILTTDEEVAEVKAPKKDKLADMLRAQEAQLVGFEKAAAESQRKGELLYEQYAELKPLLEKLRAVRKKQAEFDEVLKHPLIKGYDPKTGMLTIPVLATTASPMMSGSSRKKMRPRQPQARQNPPRRRRLGNGPRGGSSSGKGCSGNVKRVIAAYSSQR